MIASSPTEAKQMALFLITLIELSFLNTENSLKLYLLRKSPNFIELVCIYKSIFNHNKLYRLMSLQPENKAPGDVTQHNPMSGTQYDSPPNPILMKLGPSHKFPYLPSSGLNQKHSNQNLYRQQNLPDYPI